MKTKALILAALIGSLLSACTGTSRHVMTDKDVAAVKVAQANQDKTWTDTESTTHELTCLSYAGSFCLLWQRNAPAGMWECNGDTTAYNNETIISDTAASGFGSVSCVGWTNGGGYWSNLASTDWNDAIQSVKNNVPGRTLFLYEHANTGGSYWQLAWSGSGAQNVSSAMAGKTSSLSN